jgi:hypothetical protein
MPLTASSRVVAGSQQYVGPIVGRLLLQRSRSSADGVSSDLLEARIAYAPVTAPDALEAIGCAERAHKGRPRIQGHEDWLRPASALNGLAIAALRSHRATQNAKRLRKGDGYTAHDLVFATSRPWNPGAISIAFDRLACNAKLSATRLHDVRHSAATRFLQSGVDVRTVASVLGHRGRRQRLTPPAT